jgi:hypothetical protein
METTTRAIIKLQVAARCLIPDELILESMWLRCNRVNDKAARLGTMIIILNLLHDNGFYFMTGN